MKILFFITVLFFATAQGFAQTPPKIRVPGKITMPQGCFKTNTSFTKGQRYYSADNRYCLIFQEDGNLVIYKFSTPTKFKAVWNSHTNGLAIKSCVFQEDGNLVLYDFAGKAKWAANGGSVDKGGFGKGDKFYPKGPDSHWLTLQNDGNLVIYVGKYPSATSRWSTGSFEKN
ncbi:MAG: hypothetical protein WDM90_15535 [Ferruginibacter sp.]